MVVVAVASIKMISGRDDDDDDNTGEREDAA